MNHIFVSWKAMHESFSATEILDKSLQHNAIVVFCIAPVELLSSQSYSLFSVVFLSKTRVTVNQCCAARFRTAMLIYFFGQTTSLAQLGRGQVQQRLKSRVVFVNSNFKEPSCLQECLTLKSNCLGSSRVSNAFYLCLGSQNICLVLSSLCLFFILVYFYFIYFFFNISFRVMVKVKAEFPEDLAGRLF